MNRRNFIKLSSATLLFTACQTEYSPYQVNKDKTLYNVKAIEGLVASNLTYPLKIALISDTHDYFSDFNTVVKNINAHTPKFDFVLHGGDITDVGIEKEFELYKKISDRLAMPIVTVSGNHDAISNGIYVYHNSYGPSEYSYKIAQTHFICLNTNTWEFGFKELDLDWLEEELQKASSEIATEGGNIIVMHHIPHDDEERFSEEEIARYKGLMGKYAVSLSINGHNHGYEVEKFNGVQYITIGSVSKKSYVALTINDATRENYVFEKIDV